MIIVEHATNVPLDVLIQPSFDSAISMFRPLVSDAKLGTRFLSSRDQHRGLEDVILDMAHVLGQAIVEIDEINIESFFVPKM